MQFKSVCRICKIICEKICKICYLLHAICKICKIICTICKICKLIKVTYQYIIGKTYVIYVIISRAQIINKSEAAMCMRPTPGCGTLDSPSLVLPVSLLLKQKRPARGYSAGVQLQRALKDDLSALVSAYMLRMRLWHAWSDV